MHVHLFTTSNGRRSVEKYLDELTSDEAAHVVTMLQDIEEQGLAGTIAKVKHLRGDLYELKIRQHRLLFIQMMGPDILLLHAYKKQSGKAPRRELAIAEKRMKLARASLK